MIQIRKHSPPVDRSAFTGYRFPPEVIMLAVRWYLRYGLSYRDVEELLTERGIEVDHVTIHRWVQRFTPLLIDAARPADTPLEVNRSGKCAGSGSKREQLVSKPTWNTTFRGFDLARNGNFRQLPARSGSESHSACCGGGGDLNSPPQYGI
jgi:hypothetical protein